MSNSTKKKDDIFVFSDIHGCANEFKLLLNKLPLEKNSTLIFLGDYVDRGENSKEVIDVIIDLKKKYHIITLKGNHEDLFIEFLANSTSVKSATFIYNGGGSTLASYGNSKGEFAIPNEHANFLENLVLFHETEDYFFVHAGVPNIALNEIRSDLHADQLMWLRHSFINSNFNWGKTIIHGHTPTREVVVSGSRINIDTGCVYNNRLTALHLPDKQIYSVALNQRIKEVVLRDLDSKRRTVRFAGSIPVYIFIEGIMHEFETINYSVRGMFIRDVINTDIDVLAVGQKVIGEIGRHNQDTLRFEGDVIRRVNENNSIHYAINITKNPFEFLSKPFG